MINLLVQAVTSFTESNVIVRVMIIVHLVVNLKTFSNLQLYN